MKPELGIRNTNRKHQSTAFQSRSAINWSLIILVLVLSIVVMLQFLRNDDLTERLLAAKDGVAETSNQYNQERNNYERSLGKALADNAQLEQRLALANKRITTDSYLLSKKLKK